MHVIHHVNKSYFVNRLVLSTAGCCIRLLLELKLLSASHIHLAMLTN